MPSWQERAACRGYDEPPFTAERRTQQEERAMRAVCEGCPVYQECLGELVRERPEYLGGFRAGMSQKAWREYQKTLDRVSRRRRRTA